MEVIRQDIEVKGLSEGILLDRNEWRKLIHVPEPTLFSHGSCSLPQILGTNGLVVVVVVIIAAKVGVAGQGFILLNYR